MRTLFSIVLTEEELDILGCLHNEPDDCRRNREWCRPCSVTDDCWSAADQDQMWFKREDDFQSLSKRVSGWTDGPLGRAALCRMIALAMGHPEPLDPEDRTTARETFNSYA